MLRVCFDNLQGEGDLVVSEEGHDTTHGLETAIILSLMLDRPALPSDDVPEGAPKRGWWGDAFPLVPGDQVGSRLWLLERMKVNGETLRFAREAASEALQWMIEDGVIESVEIRNEWNLGRPGHMNMWAGVKRPGQLAPQFFGPWDLFYGEV